MKTPMLMAAIAAALTVSTAEAREGHGQRAGLPAFEELDLDANGGVTPEEIETAMQARAAERFAETDTNGDGALSAEEMIAAVQSERAERMADRIAERIEKADENGDGLLQLEEMQAMAEDRGRGGPDRLFNRFDTDEDGSLSAEEFAAAQERMLSRGDRGPRGDRDGRGGN